MSMAGRRWPFNRGLTLLVLLLTVPRCTCMGCGPQESAGCGLDWGGGGGCGPSSTCPDVVPAGTHTINTVGTWGGCTLECENGWSDCDGNPNNGCETPGVCPPDASKKDAGPKAELLKSLMGAPRGLATCDTDLLYYFDDDALFVLNTGTNASAQVLTSSGVPSGGIACDSANVYWATLSDPDGGGPNGGVWSVPFGQDAATAIATGVDPGWGIDVRAPRVYWLARSGLGPAGPMLAYSLLDGGSFGVMPAAETEAYKAFALSFDGDYALLGGSLWFNPIDPDAGPAHATALDTDAATALFAAAGGAYAVLHGSYNPVIDAGVDATPDAEAGSDADTDASADASDASDAATDATGDAGDAASEAEASAPAPTDLILGVTGSPTLVASGLKRIVATTGSGSAIVASDDTIYFVDLPVGAVTILATGVLHVADVAMDAKYAYWTTRGEGTLPAAIWRIALP